MSTTEFDTLLYVENLSVNNNSAKELTLNDTNSTDNTLFIKTEAIFKILSQLGFPWRSLLVFKLLPRFLRDKAYLFIARNRYRLFGKKDHCLLPSPDHESRYLSSTHYRVTK